MVAASVWGDPAVGAYVKTFDGTVVGMEKTAAFLNNLPFCLDDFSSLRTAKAVLHSMFISWHRALAEPVATAPVAWI